MIERYKEIYYGIAIGISMWVLDAMMHASMHGHLGWHSFLQELLANDVTQVFFRCLFVMVSVAFGYALWRSNKRKLQVQDLQAAIDAFHRQTINPLMLISGYASLLSLKEGWPASREDIDLVREIQLNARKINEVINKMQPPGAPFMTNNHVSLINAETPAKAYENLQKY